MIGGSIQQYSRLRIILAISLTTGLLLGLCAGVVGIVLGITLPTCNRKGTGNGTITQVISASTAAPSPYTCLPNTSTQTSDYFEKITSDFDPFSIDKCKALCSLYPKCRSVLLNSDRYCYFYEIPPTPLSRPGDALCTRTD